MTPPQIRAVPVVLASVGAVAAAALLAAPGAQSATPTARPGMRAALSPAIVRSGATALTTVIDTTRPVVVTSGLNNPRELSLLPDGSVLLVAEAGSGGPTCSSGGPDGQTCVGATGAISSITAPRYANRVAPTRIITNLLSAAGPDGTGAVGADGVSATNLNQIYTVMTYAPPDVIPSGLPGEQAGKLLRNPAYRKPAIFADITAYEVAHDPDGQGVDSNPYAVLALPGRTLVTDAAGNDILSVSPRGTVSLFAVLPNIQTGQCAGRPNDNGTTGCDFVPTSLAQGPDGAIYVTGLAGEARNAGKVLKLDQYTGAVLRTYSGFTLATGVAVGPDGSVYVSELSTDGSFDPSKGAVVKIVPGGTRVQEAVPFPAGLAVDPATGGVYVSAFSVSPATGVGIPGVDTSGQVWRLRYAAPTSPTGSTGNTPPVDRS